MKTVEPKIIDLQVGEDADLNEFKKEDFETNAITWCWERIYKNDVEYISKGFILSLIDKMIKEIKITQKDPNLAVYEFDKNIGWLEVLTELKEKILETKK